ncbi:unnamed protein product, partial [Ixodes pacificus]
VQISHGLSVFPLACVAAYDVDLDDYEGRCGAPGARLQALRTAQVARTTRQRSVRAHVSAGQGRYNAAMFASADDSDGGVRDRRRRCMAPGSEYRRPLVCVLSDRIDRARNITKQLCTHIVLSLRRFGAPGALASIPEEYLRRLSSPGVKVLVALHESLLLGSEAEPLAEATAVLLRGSRLDGLAFLYVSDAHLSAQLPKLKRAQVLHDTYAAAGLCLLLSVQVEDPGPTRSRSTAARLGDVARHVDLLVLHTHNSGSLGPCRAVPSTVAAQPASPCLPTLALDTALGWARSMVGAAFLCLSADMRALRFGMDGKPVVHGTCSSQAALDVGAACSEPGWSPVHEAPRESVVWQKGSTLQTFDTARSLRERVQAIAALPDTCVAAFNYDYDDYAGVCDDGEPHARLLAIREALGKRSLLCSKLYRSHEVSCSEQNWCAGLAGAGRPLVCILSPGVRNQSQLPSSHCSHLVHEGATFDPWTRKLSIPESVLWLAARRPSIRHLAGIGGEQLVDGLLRASAKELGEAAVALSSALLAAKMHGVAILNLNRTSKTISEFGQVLAVLHRGMAEGLELLLGVEVLDAGLPKDLAARRLSDVARHVDILVLQTHYRGARGYCQLTLPSADRTQASTLALVLSLLWAKGVDAGAHVCVSFTLSVLEFRTIENSSAGCSSASLLDYGATCDDKDWSVDTKRPLESAVVRRKKGLVQTFESADSLARKVSRTLDGRGCVALFDVDKEASGCHANSRKFGRVAAVAESYVELEKRAKAGRLLLPPIPAGELLFFRFSLAAKHASRGHGDSCLFCAPRMSSSQMFPLAPGADRRPFVCLLSSAWRGDTAALPKSLCTHVLIDEEEETKNKQFLYPIQAVSIKVPLPSVPLLSANQPVLLDTAQGVMLWEECRSRPSVAQGTHVEPRAFRFQALLGVLPQPPSLLLGLELADWKGKGALVARRMAPLLELANLVVLQTHFTRHWRFCRAAHVSLYAPPTSDACPQSTPALTALEWMSRLEPSSTPVCLSFNMAAVEFRGLAYPSAGSPCETSREIAPPCAGYGWQSGQDSNGSLTAHAYRDDVWISQETGALLREKVLMASRRLPKLCVAVFNVDMDSPAFRCRGAGDEAFPRVSELARSARSLESDKNMKGALVCVLSPAAIHLDRFPAHLCSYLVFPRHLDAEQATPPDVLPLPGSRYASFLKLCARTRTPALVATVPSALSPLFVGGTLSEAPARRLSVALLKAGLGGMAVFAAPDEDLALLDQYLE